LTQAPAHVRHILAYPSAIGLLVCSIDCPVVIGWQLACGGGNDLGAFHVLGQPSESAPKRNLALMTKVSTSNSESGLTLT
jgi:hypothetical protein